MTHLACADEDAALTARQLDRFDEAVARLAARGIRPPLDPRLQQRGPRPSSARRTPSSGPGLILYGVRPRPLSPGDRRAAGDDGLGRHRARQGRRRRARRSPTAAAGWRRGPRASRPSPSATRTASRARTACATEGSFPVGGRPRPGRGHGVHGPHDGRRHRPPGRRRGRRGRPVRRRPRRLGRGGVGGHQRLGGPDQRRARACPACTSRAAASCTSNRAPALPDLVRAWPQYTIGRWRRARRSRPSSPARRAASRARKWLGRCPDCGEWNSFVEERQEAPRRPARAARPALGTARSPSPTTSSTARRRTASPPASASSTACSAAASCPARWSSSAASRGSARARCSCRSRTCSAAQRRRRALRLGRGIRAADQAARRAARHRRRRPLPAWRRRRLERILEHVDTAQAGRPGRRLRADRLLVEVPAPRPAASARCARWRPSSCSWPRGAASRRS